VIYYWTDARQHGIYLLNRTWQPRLTLADCDQHKFNITFVLSLLDLRRASAHCLETEWHEASIIFNFLIIKKRIHLWGIACFLVDVKNLPPRSLTAVKNSGVFPRLALADYDHHGLSLLYLHSSILVFPLPTDLKQNDSKLFRNNELILVMHDPTALGDHGNVSHLIFSQQSETKSFSRPRLSLIVMITMNYDWLTDISITLGYLCDYWIWFERNGRIILHINGS